MAQLADFRIVPAPGPAERADGWCQVFVVGTPVTGGPGFAERLVAWLDAAGLDGLPGAEPEATARAA